MDAYMGLVEAKDVWYNIFPIHDSNRKLPNIDNSILKSRFEELCLRMEKTGLHRNFLFNTITQIKMKLRNEIMPEFWKYFNSSECDDREFRHFYDGVDILYENYKYLDAICSRLDLFKNATGLDSFLSGLCESNSVPEILRITLKCSVLNYSGAPNRFEKSAMIFYEFGLKKFEELEDQTKDFEGYCTVCNRETDCVCLNMFWETTRKLGELQITDFLVGQTLTNVTHEHVLNYLQKMCKDNYESLIEGLLKWIFTVVLPYLKKIYDFDKSILLEESMEMFERKFTNFLYAMYIKVRIDQLFNIIIEYPESLPALEDIRTCLPKTDLKPLLVKKLQQAMSTRLLHPGVSTPDILTAYVATIRSLKVLDQTGLLLETIANPIHEYLRTREDTVRCVVSSLTEEGPNDLAEELNRGEPLDENTPVDDDDDDWKNWMPDPVDLIPSKKIPKDVVINRRNMDIISMLVNIYGSKELFVNEYRTLLADRLLSQDTCDTEKEIRYLELLKLRFGDVHLHFCEVMLKDIADSKRINQRIKEDASYSDSDVPLSTIIVSQQFWPPFKDKTFEPHEKVLKQMKGFTTAFETLKGSRTLCWKNHLGVVNLEVESNGRLLNLSVTPVHATILLHFQDKDTWELEELSKVMQCPSTVLRRKMALWIAHCVLTETENDVFTVLKEEENPTGENFYDEEDESESAMASVKDQKEEELQNMWSYIVGMLMNLDSLPLEKIYHMLKLFAFQGPTAECTQAELKRFLDRKVTERQLIFANGVYKISK